MSWCSRSCLYDAAVVSAILCGGLNMGLNLGLIGPALPDLAVYTGVSITTMSTIITWRSLAFILGSLASGFLLEYIEGYLCISVILFLQAFTTALSPWFRNFIVLSILQACASFFSTIIISGTTYLCFQLEKSKARIVSQATFVLFNLGKTVVPFIVGPFLAPKANNTDITTTPGTVPSNLPPTSNEVTNNSTNLIVRAAAVKPLDSVAEMKVGWPFVIVGAFCVLMSILYFSISLVNGCNWRAEKRSKRTTPEEQTEAPPFTKRRLNFVLAIFCLISLFENGIEFLDGNLLMTQVSVFMQRTKLMGLIVTAVYQGIKIFICIGTVFIAHKVHPSILLVTDAVFMVIGTITMTIAIIVDTDALFYIGIIGLAIGMANFYASQWSWLQLYIPITGKHSSMVTLCFGLGGMAIPPLATWLLNLYGPVVFPACQLAITIICTILIIIFKFALKESCCPRLPANPTVTFSEENTETSPLLEDKNGTISNTHSKISP